MKGRDGSLTAHLALGTALAGFGALTVIAAWTRGPVAPLAHTHAAAVAFARFAALTVGPAFAVR